MTTTFLLFILAIAGACKAVMDTLAFHQGSSVFKSDSRFFGPNSWENQYSNVATLSRRRWFGTIPVPAFLTNGWHLFQFFLLNSIFLIMAWYFPLHVILDWFSHPLVNTITEKALVFVVIRSIFGGSFILFYNYLLVKKDA